MWQKKMSRRRVRLSIVLGAVCAVVALAGTLAVTTGLAQAAAGAARHGAGNQRVVRTFQVTFQTEQFNIDCPPEDPTVNVCLGFSGSGNATVLGETTISRVAYGNFTGATDCIPFVSNGTLKIAGGTLKFQAGGQFCQTPNVASYVFLITGGTGKFEHASGSGTITVPFTATQEPEIWSGTLVLGDD
jgi:hypothetical protein